MSLLEIAGQTLVLMQTAAPYQIIILIMSAKALYYLLGWNGLQFLL